MMFLLRVFWCIFAKVMPTLDVEEDMSLYKTGNICSKKPIMKFHTALEQWKLREKMSQRALLPFIKPQRMANLNVVHLFQSGDKLYHSCCQAQNWFWHHLGQNNPVKTICLRISGIKWLQIRYGEWRKRLSLFLWWFILAHGYDAVTVMKFCDSPSKLRLISRTRFGEWCC